MHRAVLVALEDQAGLPTPVVHAGSAFDPPRPAGATPRPPRDRSVAARRAARRVVARGRDRRRDRRPQGLERARWHRRQSTASALSANSGDRRFDGHRAASSTAGPIEDFVKGWGFCFLGEPLQQELLQRLPSRSRATTKRRVHLGGDILDLNARHGAIMALAHAEYKRPLTATAWSKTNVDPHVIPTQ